MRTPKEIKRRIKDIRYRYIQKKFKKYLSRRPENCVFNFRQPLPKENDTIGLCIPLNDPKNINEVEWQGSICENVEDTLNCSRFKCKITKKELVRKLDAEIANPEICKEQYREIHELKWALEGVPRKFFLFKILSKFLLFFKKKTK